MKVAIPTRGNVVDGHFGPLRSVHRFLLLMEIVRLKVQKYYPHRKVVVAKSNIACHTKAKRR